MGLTKEEKERTKLSPDEIESKKLMLARTESEKENYEQAVTEEEYRLKYKVGIKKLESDISQIEAQIEANKILLPILKEGLKKEKPRLNSLNTIKQYKDLIKRAESNIKVLRKQINTGYA